MSGVTPTVQAQRAGLTLVEVVTSLTILSIVMGAACSALVVAAHAVDAGTSNASQRLAAEEALGQVVADLQVAIAFSERTASAATFTVPDRNSDGQPETLRYAWSGAAGDPLTRQVNGGEVVPLAKNVYGFNLSYLTQNFGPPPPPPPVEGPEQQLACRAWGTPTDIKNLALKNTTWCSEYFKPTMPSNAVSWKITRLKVQLKRNGTATGNVDIQVKAADAALKPTGSVLGSGSVDISTISSSAYVWAEIPLSNLSGLDPTRGYCVLVSTSASAPGSAAYDQKSTDATMAWSTTTNSGSTWSTPTSTSAMELYVYGTVTTQP
jgi:prepilin-type N-terminal cleavage/methylation domain-containing protein